MSFEFDLECHFAYLDYEIVTAAVHQDWVFEQDQCPEFTRIVSYLKFVFLE